MNDRGVALVEIVVSMIILSVAALAVTATVSLVNSEQHRSAGGSSVDLQALSYARETLDSLKNNVSSNVANAVPLEPSGVAYDLTDTLPLAFRGPPFNARREYTVTNVPGTDIRRVTVCVAWSPDTCE